MMKKQSKILVLLLLLLLAACNSGGKNTNVTVSTNQTGKTEEVPENEVRITISINDGKQFINEQQVEIENGANLLEVLADTFFIETDENDEIISIERREASENSSWKLFINGEITETRAADYKLTGGEKIIFDLQEK